MSSFSFHAEALKTLDASASNTQKKIKRKKNFKSNDDKNNLHMKTKHRSSHVAAAVFITIAVVGTFIFWLFSLYSLWICEEKALE